MKFALITPSRGRPERLREMLESALHTADRAGDVTAHAVLDADDPALDAYLAAVPSQCVVTVQGQREFLSQAFQTGAARALHDGADILMMCGDDVLFRTRRWDTKVRECLAQYRDGLALVYPDDGNGNNAVNGDVKGNHWFVTRRWVEVVGCFCPPVFEHFCSDTVPEKIAEQAGCFVHLPDVLVEHMHFKHLKSKKDDTYAYARERDDQGRSMSDRDCARMAEMAPWIAERAAAVRAAARHVVPE